MLPETSPTNQISIEPYQNAFNKSVSLFSLLPPNEIYLDGAVPVIQITSESKRPIEIPEMLRKFLEIAIHSEAVMAREVAFTPKDIFMILETKDSGSPQIFGAVFNLTKRIFFTRKLVMKDAKSVNPLLEPTETRSNYIAITKDGISILTSLIENILQQPNARYSSHEENPIKLFSSFRYFMSTEGVTKGGN